MPEDSHLRLQGRSGQGSGGLLTDIEAERAQFKERFLRNMTAFQNALFVPLDPTAPQWAPPPPELPEFTTSDPNSSSTDAEHPEGWMRPTGLPSFADAPEEGDSDLPNTFEEYLSMTDMPAVFHIGFCLQALTKAWKTLG